MTNEEAIKLIKPLMLSSINTSVAAEKRPIVYAFDMAIKALEKQIPKKPIVAYRGAIDGVERYSCPGELCHSMLHTGAPFCEQCGQAIDWSCKNA